VSLHDPDVLAQRIRERAYRLQLRLGEGVVAEGEADELLTLLRQWCELALPWGPDKEWASQLLDRHARLQGGERPPRGVVLGPLTSPLPRHATLLSVIRGRRSIRFWEPQPVPRDVLATLIEQACWAPSAFNRQPWRFCVVENVPASMVAGDTSNASLVAKAPARIYVAVDTRLGDEEFAPAIDAGLAAQNLLLAAHAHGLGGCVLYQAETADEAALREYFGLAEGWRIFLVVLLGYPAEDPAPPARCAWDEVTTIKRAVPGLDTFLG